MQPSLVIVYFGGNDSVSPHPSGLGQDVPLSEYIENMRKIVVHLKVIFLGRCYSTCLNAILLLKLHKKTS